MRPIRVRIDSAALRHNLDAARRRAPRSRICAVVKANAYGHGLARAVRALAAAEGLALVELEAALELRRSGERRPIMLLQGFFSPEELEPIATQALTIVVHQPEQLAMLEKARLPKRVAVVVKLNSGMNRLGFPAEDLRGVLERLRDCPNAGVMALMTHFADADGKRGVRWQLERFEAASAGVDLPKSLANSAALLPAHAALAVCVGEMRHKRYHADTRTIVQAFEHAAKILRREAEPVHAAVQLHDHRDPLR